MSKRGRLFQIFVTFSECPNFKRESQRVPCEAFFKDTGNNNNLEKVHHFIEKFDR